MPASAAGSPDGEPATAAAPAAAVAVPAAAEAAEADDGYGGRAQAPRLLAAAYARTKSRLLDLLHAPSRLAPLAAPWAPGLRRRLNVTVVSPPSSPHPFQLTPLPLSFPLLLPRSRLTTDSDVIDSRSIPNSCNT